MGNVCSAFLDMGGFLGTPSKMDKEAEKLFFGRTPKLGDREYKVERGPTDPSGSESYDGCLYTNTFHVKRPIYLTKIGFHGPSEKCAIFKRVDLFVSKVQFKKAYPFQYLVYDHRTYNVVAHQTEEFVVSLPRPVRIEPLDSTHYDIQFELKGPKTCVSRKNVIETSVVTNTKLGRILFYFHNGSKQMKSLYFKVAASEDYSDEEEDEDEDEENDENGMGAPVASTSAAAAAPKRKKCKMCKLEEAVEQVRKQQERRDYLRQLRKAEKSKQTVAGQIDQTV